MAGEKYIVAVVENSLQVLVRNILNPGGYVNLSSCAEIQALTRQIKGFSPDFVLIDTAFNTKDIRQVLETVEDDINCTIVLLGNKDTKVLDLIETTNSLFVAPKPPTREILLYCVETALIYNKKITNLNKKLSVLTSNVESRKAVERAKGILMERFSLNEEAAYSSMRKCSMDSRMSLRDVAEEIINSKVAFKNVK